MASPPEPLTPTTTPTLTRRPSPSPAASSRRPISPNSNPWPDPVPIPNQAEHLAAHILSNLPCFPGGGDWTMAGVRRLRSGAFAPTSWRATLSRGAEDASESEEEEEEEEEGEEGEEGEELRKRG